MQSNSFSQTNLVFLHIRKARILTHPLFVRSSLLPFPPSTHLSAYPPFPLKYILTLLGMGTMSYALLKIFNLLSNTMPFK